jgi:hypothetical protein
MLLLVTTMLNTMFWQYPACPPLVSFVTTDKGRVRFNPNLYKGAVTLA